MSVLRRMFGAEESRSQAGAPGWGPWMVWTNGPVGWGNSGTDDAMRLSAVYACLRLLSEAVATLPLDVEA